MGKSAPKAPKNPYQDALGNIATQLFQETTPLRQGITSNFENLIGIDPRVAQLNALRAQAYPMVTGKKKNMAAPNASLQAQIDALQSDISSNPFQGSGQLFSPVTMDNLTTSPLYGALKQANEQQFDQSRDRIMELLPTGGSLNQGLIDASLSRANSFTSQLGGLAESEQNRRNMLLSQALGLSTGGVTGAMQGLGNVSSLKAQSNAQETAMQQAQMQQDTAKAGEAGEMIGLAVKMGMCWVARAVYGDDNPRWIDFYYWKENSAPAWFRFLYNSFGRYFAMLIYGERMKAIIRRWMDSKIGIPS